MLRERIGLAVVAAGLLDMSASELVRAGQLVYALDPPTRRMLAVVLTLHSDSCSALLKTGSRTLWTGSCSLQRRYLMSWEGLAVEQTSTRAGCHSEKSRDAYLTWGHVLPNHVSLVKWNGQEWNSLAYIVVVVVVVVGIVVGIVVEIGRMPLM